MGEFPEHTNQKNTQTRKLKDFQNPELTARHLQSETSVPDYAKAMPGKPETTDSFANLNYLNGAVLIFDKPYHCLLYTSRCV